MEGNSSLRQLTYDVRLYTSFILFELLVNFPRAIHPLAAMWIRPERLCLLTGLLLWYELSRWIPTAEIFIGLLGLDVQSGFLSTRAERGHSSFVPAYCGIYRRGFLGRARYLSFPLLGTFRLDRLTWQVGPDFYWHGSSRRGICSRSYWFVFNHFDTVWICLSAEKAPRHFTKYGPLVVLEDWLGSHLCSWSSWDQGFNNENNIQVNYQQLTTYSHVST
jgi:hypothetical protein